MAESDGDALEIDLGRIARTGHEWSWLSTWGRRSSVVSCCALRCDAGLASTLSFFIFVKSLIFFHNFRVIVIVVKLIILGRRGTWTTKVLLE